jgi:SAM-dependent methyltransferase
MNRDWIRLFFTGLWVEFQQKLWPAEKSQAEAVLIERMLRLTGPTRLLDAPCGDGRLTLELARRGHKTVGIDICPELLAGARDKSDAEKLDASFTLGDMADINEERAYGAAICVWGSLGYRAERDDLKFLRGVHKALAPGGGFVLEAATMESLFTNFQETGWRKAGEVFALEKRVWRPETSRIECEWTLIKGGRVEIKYSSIRVYCYREIVAMLFDAGFEGVKSFNSAGEESKSFNENSLYFKARRPGA